MSNRAGVLGHRTTTVKPAAAIILLCTLAAITYGVLHDQVTAHLCVEYFTIGHPPIFGTESPTLLGLGWGVIATWWVGAGLGIGLAIAARAGRRPKTEPRALIRPLLLLLAVTAALAAASGLLGHIAATNRWILLVPRLADRIPEDRHARFLAVGTAHTVSYAAGALGGLVLIVRTWRSRRPDPARSRPAMPTPQPDHPPDRVLE